MFLKRQILLYLTPAGFLTMKDLKDLFWSSGQKESEKVRVPERVTTSLSNWNSHKNKQLLENSMGKVVFYYHKVNIFIKILWVSKTANGMYAF